MTTNRFLLTLLIILLPSLHSQSQEVLIDEQPTHTNIPENWGPNRANHLQFIVDFGCHLSLSGDIIPIKFIGSYNFAGRLQYKRKLTPVFALLLLSGVEQNRVVFPSSFISPISFKPMHEKEWLRLDWLSSLAFTRINFDKKRGDYLGTYCDIGMFYNYLLASRSVIINTNIHQDTPFNNQKTIMKGLHYINKQRWGLALRLGFNTLTIQYLYQLSKPVFTSYFTLNYPIHELGITIAIPR